MLMPKRTKFRKVQRGRMNGTAQRGTEVTFGEYGLKSVETGKITSRQIEAARVAINRKVKRGGKLWIRIFPDFAFTKKPAEVRMGSGKGSPEGFVARIKPGKILFEIAGVDQELAKIAFNSASNKLPVKTKFVEINK